MSNRRLRPKKRQQAKSRPLLPRLFWGMIGIGFRLALLCGFVLAGVVFYYYASLPELEELVDGRPKGSVTFKDRNGEAFAWRGAQFDGSLRAETAAPVLIDAIVATEDRRFFNHFGVSPRGIARAMQNNYRENGNPFRGEGGSTITIQVAKLLCLGTPYDESYGNYKNYEETCRRGSISRKLAEIPYAIALELKYTKNDILSIYLNRAYLGFSSYGFSAAAQRYFDVKADELSISQSAMLAGMLTAPSRFAPTGSLKRSQDRAATVIRLLEEQGYISAEDAAYAMANPATLSPLALSDEGIFFADWLMRDQPSFLTSETTEDLVFETTFDPRIQNAAEDAVQHVFDTRVRASSGAQAAIVVLSKDGAVRAVVGGRKEEDRIEGGFNRATQALRQPGSSFKPFVYAAGLESGMDPYQVFVDQPINIKGWQPKNYSGRYSGAMSMLSAFRYSTNTIAVQISEQVGRDNVIRIAKGLGINSPIINTPAMALGTSEVTLLELTTAYAGILNGGRSTPNYGINNIILRDDNEVILSHDNLPGDQIISERTARELTFMMSEVVNNGTGKNAQLPDRQAAGKTGTTQSARDALFVGFTSDFVVGVWMGYDDNTPLTKVTGGDLPAVIWRETLTRINQGVKPKPLEMYVPPAPAPPPPPKPKPENTAPQPAPAPSQNEQNLLNDIINSVVNQLLNN